MNIIEKIENLPDGGTITELSAGNWHELNEDEWIYTDDLKPL